MATCVVAAFMEGVMILPTILIWLLEVYDCRRWQFGKRDIMFGIIGILFKAEMEQ